MTKSEATAQMERLITLFPSNMKEAMNMGKKAIRDFRTAPVTEVLISGLGGSGIGGKIMSQMVWDECSVPINLVHDYRIPAYVGPGTLFIASSYSGNTEETLNTLHLAMQADAQIVCITSGGKMELLAREHGLNLITIPPGQPPRTSFGYNAMQLLYIFSAYGLISDEFETGLSKAADLLTVETTSIKTEAAAIANKIHGTLPIVYAETYFEGVAVRLRQQINENAKTLCWHHVLPEMNHNELVAWAGGSDRFSVVMIRTPEDHPGTSKRMDLTQEIIGKHTERIVELRPKGSSRIEWVYYLIHLGDWISFYLAVEGDVDPIEIEVIDYFKAELAKS